MINNVVNVNFLDTICEPQTKRLFVESITAMCVNFRDDTDFLFQIEHGMISKIELADDDDSCVFEQQMMESRRDQLIHDLSLRVKEVFLLTENMVPDDMNDFLTDLVNAVNGENV